MRLIDADELDSVVFRLNFKGNAHITRLEYKLIESVMNVFTTIDAVPVVRCKNCKYFLDSSERCGIIDTRLHFYETDKRWTGDNFCSWAERKNDEID